MQARNNVLEVGSGSGLLSRKITRYINEACYTMWDLAAPCLKIFRSDAAIFL